MHEFMYRYLNANKNIDIMMSVNIATGKIIMTTRKNKDMNQIARKFNGGGHKQIAGGTLGEEFTDKIWKSVEKNIINGLSYSII